ncbi:Retrovirus-related Pol polyprotein from transposon 17.6 [Dictyocoela muelleri]|nr:Retrovirus-related Pol polyprotein from transposon 17.6 [Dictyocoela muelleri]
MKDKLTYLGFEISNGKYKPDISKMVNFTKWDFPKTKRQLQKLLVKINWYTKFIPNISEKLGKLHDKIKGKNNKVFIENEEMHHVYEIYDSIRNQMCLNLPDLNKKFYIHSDASDFAIGAVLSQEKGVVDSYIRKLTSS